MIRLKQFRDDENSEPDEKWIPELISAEKERKKRFELKRTAKRKAEKVSTERGFNGTENISYNNVQ